MKETLITLLTATMGKLQCEGLLPNSSLPPISVTPSKDPQHGDFASNCALVLAKIVNQPPRTVAEKIIAALPTTDFIAKVEIAGPGFINFFCKEGSFLQIIPTILAEGDDFGCHKLPTSKRIHIEYVSANPTGPLHVGHGRGAAYGASVANILKAAGYSVHREYYVNDAGRQMRILTLSVWIRYLQLQQQPLSLPEHAYQGDYIIDIARELIEQYGNRFYHPAASIDAHLTQTGGQEDSEKYLDQMIEIAQTMLGEQSFEQIFQVALNAILADIRQDLSEFGVVYDAWFHESTLFKKDLIQAGIQLLADQGYVYEQGGAKWFRATQFGDEKDRVLVRSNGVTTYFASDVAYHLYKYQQGFDQIIDVFGADHHGYLTRIQAFLQGLGEDPTKVKTLLVQFAILYRGKEKVAMSTRAGQFVTLRELRTEVGNDAARFFYIMRKPEQHLDFDLELAKSQSNDNPVYYIQYAHARVCSVWRQLQHQQHSWDKKLGLEHLSLLISDYEKDLLNSLTRYPDTIKTAAQNYEPHLVAHFLLDLATYFHTYYNAEKFLVDDAKLRNARLCLIKAVQQVIQNGLSLLGISAPSEM